MTHFVPCPSCARHVKTSEASCPFCSAALALAGTLPPVLPTARLSRAAQFAFGATLLGVSAVVGCGGESESGDDDDTAGRSGSSSGGTAGAGRGGTAGTSSGGTSTGGVDAGFGGGQAIYGAPPVGGTTGAGGTAGTGGSAGAVDGGIAPPYGFPPEDAGTPGPVYGAAPSE